MNPSAATPLIASIDSPWLPPVCFGEKPYVRLCKQFEKALRQLEAQYPVRHRTMTLEARNKFLKRKPK
ncbi:MAG: hypothetical protein IT425_05895 [Pirellulales bacterium]|nr:hypothetical protein [Pirellulales bacterium]